ncbi:exo-alpha-sialidase [Luteimonas sp. MC1825]|nr:exo-alpha-sialidase [Luteimonas sp. MC1825]QOC87967.1 exo-alpha-sialidase [Luteimonas sp. MC1825]
MPSRRRVALTTLMLAMSAALNASAQPGPGPSANIVGHAPSTTDSAASCHHRAFRVRADFEAALNADTGWAGALDERATVTADQPFRLRIELETGSDLARRFWLQYRRNDGAWTDIEAADVPYPLLTPPVSVVVNEEYAHGDRSEDLLPGSRAAFGGGAGVVHEATTPPFTGAGVQSEWEWPLVIRRYADGAASNDTGDRFQFRMVDTRGACEADVAPAVTLQVPAFHLGGTFVETPGPIGPWQAFNGDLYFVIEPAETTNVLMMVKSSDGGRSWREVDGAHRPATDDLEGFATAFAADTVHMLHQTAQVWHHAFRTSDHPTHPDTWAVRDEPVAAPGKPPTQVAALASRSDGSLVGVYGGPQRIHYRIRTRDGQWGAETVIDADTARGLSGPMLATGKHDVVHLAYTGNDGTAWYRRIAADGQLSPRQQLADNLDTGEGDVGSILPLVYLPDTDSVAVLYRTASGHLWERRIDARARIGKATRVSERRVVQNAVDSDQTGADAIALDGKVQVLFIEQGTGSIFHAASTAAGQWQPAGLQVGDVNAQWVRGRPVRNADGRQVYGFVYDAGSNGGSGMNRYGEVDPAR